MYNAVSNIAKKQSYYAILLLIIIFLLTACHQKPADNDFASGIRDVLPNGWEMTIINQKGTMGHPHALNEPLFRIDFVDHTHQFNDLAGRTMFPSARLYFYDIDEKDAILETIETQKIYSWDIPEYFDQSSEYIIVTSPPYICGGYFSEEAMVLYKPLEKALKDYFKLYR